MGRWILSRLLRCLNCFECDDSFEEDTVCLDPYGEAHQMDKPLLSDFNSDKVPYRREFPCVNHQQTSVSCLGRSVCTCGLDKLRDGRLDFNKIGKDFRALCGQPSQAQLIDNETETAAFFAKNKEVSSENIQSPIRVFSKGELRKATKNFHSSRKIGDGGSSTVYLGKLKDGRKVAVKVLLESNPEEKSRFNMEVNILSRLRHPNLVTLHGYSSPSSRKLVLLYEFLSNGTVASHLHRPETSREALPWALRMRIAIEIAEALSYLHNGQGDIPIIHCDLKTDNILLDDNFHVKIADFGQSNPFRSDINPVFLPITPASTQGYLDPQYQLDGNLTDKSDVYSFGVVLLELLSGKKAVDVDRDEVYLFEMALNMIQNAELDEFVQEDLGYHSNPEIKRMMILVAELACMCLQTERTKRPPITKVLTILNGIRDETQQSIMLLSPAEDVNTDYQDSWDQNYKFVRLYLEDIGDIDTIKQVSRLYGHNQSSIVLFYVFKVHNHLVEPICMCRVLLSRNDIFEGVINSSCFALLILNYFMVLAAINDTPQECQQNFNKLLARAYMDEN